MGGQALQVGEVYEPVQLLVTYPVVGGEEEEDTQVEVAMAFPKNATLGEVRVSVWSLCVGEGGRGGGHVCCGKPPM